MGKYVVYIRSRDELALKAAGHDPGEWVRDLVRRTLDVVLPRGTSELGPTHEVPRDFTRSDAETKPEFREIKPDFRDKDLKGKR